MNIPIAGVAHQAGTCRFGHDPATSVLDVNCKAHELDNLYVVDTSFFPSIGAVNPALTAMANALRVGRPPARAAAVASLIRAVPARESSRQRRRARPGHRAGHVPGGQHDLHRARPSTTCRAPQYGATVPPAGRHGDRRVAAGRRRAHVASTRSGSTWPDWPASLVGMGLLLASAAVGRHRRGVPDPAGRHRVRWASASGSPSRRSTPSPPRSTRTGSTGPCWSLNALLGLGHRAGAGLRRGLRRPRVLVGAAAAVGGLLVVLLGDQRSPAARGSATRPQAAGGGEPQPRAGHPAALLGVRRLRRAVRRLRDDERQLGPDSR